MTSFSAVAPYYDELMRSVPYRMWVGYYLLLLSVRESHPRTILDVCCGTGTMCEFLTEEGLQMAGLDISPGMIERAKAKAAKKGLEIDYHVADAATFELNRRYEAALSFFDSLNNILDPKALQAAFCRVADHLEPGATFIFDVNTAYAFQHRMFDQDNVASKARLRYKWVSEWDEETQEIEVRMQFWRGDKTFQEVHRQRAYPEDQLRAMLAKAGFGDIRTYHSYSLDPPRASSDRIHFSVEKL
jgi:ubiquinone/menaquinone biosynthesis C-methylase UbiE